MASTPDWPLYRLIGVGNMVLSADTLTAIDFGLDLKTTSNAVQLLTLFFTLTQFISGFGILLTCHWERKTTRWTLVAVAGYGYSLPSGPALLLLGRDHAVMAIAIPLWVSAAAVTVFLWWIEDRTPKWEEKAELGVLCEPR